MGRPVLRRTCPPLGEWIAVVASCPLRREAGAVLAFQDRSGLRAPKDAPAAWNGPRAQPRWTGHPGRRAESTPGGKASARGKRAGRVATTSVIMEGSSRGKLSRRSCGPPPFSSLEERRGGRKAPGGRGPVLPPHRVSRDRTGGQPRASRHRAERPLSQARTAPAPRELCRTAGESSRRGSLPHLVLPGAGGAACSAGPACAAAKTPGTQLIPDD